MIDLSKGKQVCEINKSAEEKNVGKHLMPAEYKQYNVYIEGHKFLNEIRKSISKGNVSSEYRERWNSVISEINDLLRGF